MHKAEQGVPEQHSSERDGDQAVATADVPDEDAVALARAAQERLASSLAAIRAVPLTIQDEPSLVFRP